MYLDDRELRVISTRAGLQLDVPADGLLGLIEALKCREVRGEPRVPAGPQRFYRQRLPRELDRRLPLTESCELSAEIDLRLGVIGRQLYRTTKLRFRTPPVEVCIPKQMTLGNVRGGELRRRASARSAASRAFGLLPALLHPQGNIH